MTRTKHQKEKWFYLFFLRDFHLLTNVTLKNGVLYTWPQSSPWTKLANL